MRKTVDITSTQGSWPHSQQVSSCSALLDSRGRIVAATPGFSECLACSPESVIGAVATSFLHPTWTEDKKLLEVPSRALFKNKEGRSLQWVSQEVWPKLAIERVVTLIDLSQVSDSELRLEHQERLATLGALTAGLAHEIAEPLTVIATNAEQLLCEESLQEQIRNSLMAVRDESRRLASLLRDFLFFVRDPPIHLARVDVAELARRCIAMLRVQSATKHVNLLLQSDDGLPPVAGDAERLQQVLVNLITNATDASAEGSEVVVKLSSTQNNSNRQTHVVEVSVEDQGIGIPEELIKRVFEPFFSTKPAEQGTGLGLPIAARIVEAHEGRLEIRSVPGKGTLARFQLPVWEK
jgi:signal transduction histidine kinase